MKILHSKRNDDRVELKIEVSVEELNAAFDKAFVKVSKNARVQGFRKGKVPRHLFERHYGREAIIQEGVMIAVNKSYGDALQESQLDVIDHPQNLSVEDYKEETPLSFTLEVDVKPEVKLGKYKGVKASKEDASVDEKLVTEQIDALRENYAEYNTVERGTSEDDIVRVDVAAKAGDAEIASWTRKNVGFKVGNSHYGTDFDAQLNGLKAGESKSFSVNYAADFRVADAAGKTVNFDITVQEVKAKQLPEVTDEFVEKVTKGDIKNVADLTKTIRDELTSRRAQEVENKFHEELIDAICQDSKVKLQPVLVERQIDIKVKEFEQELKKSGITIDKYLRMINKEMATFRESFSEIAEKQLKADLILEAIQTEEKIEASQDDLMAEIRKFNVPNLSTDDDIRAYIEKMPLDGLRSMVERRKTIDFLIEHAKIN